MFKVLLVNGPYFSFEGNHMSYIYGKTSVNEIEESVFSVLSKRNIFYESLNSNSEIEIVYWLKKNREADFLILNPGILSKNSTELRNVVLEIKIPFIEIQLTNVYNSEYSLYKSCLSDLSTGSLLGLGLKGFSLASKFAIDFLENKKKIN